MADWVADPFVFVAVYYADQNADVRKINGYDEAKLFDHWRRFGMKEGRAGHLNFQVKKYLQLNTDVSSQFGEHNYIQAIYHYLTIGYKEGRKAK